MKIPPAGRGAIDLYKTQNLKHENATRKQNQSGHDRAEISDRARDIVIYRAMLRDMPAVRPELVKHIKAGIEDGTYEPSAEKIAGGIMRERRG